MPERKIYLLSPKKFSPEVIAVAFAKTSRSPLSFQEIADELNDESSAEFHEKWVVGYGHASVAEHAVLHIAIENISRMAIECIESNRLASYTEKSTRYQKWDADAFVIPPELDGHPLRDEFERTVKMLFKTYADSLAPTRALVMERFPRRENETDALWDRRIRSKYVDACRFLLPAASIANVGMTANARVLESAIRKMLSHPLEEVRQIGERVKAVAQGETPTLVKYADAVPYLEQAEKDFSGKSDQPGAPTKLTSLIDFDPNTENKILAATLYRFGDMPYENALAHIQKLTQTERAKLAEKLLGGLDKHDIPLRELEYSRYTFDLVMDQGAYFEFKRHRIMSQTPQALTVNLGYAIPSLITEAGFQSAYVAAMDAAAETYQKLAAFNPHVAAYLVPNGFNRRALASFNLREAYHFVQLRAAKNAHFSIRRVAREVYAEIEKQHPLLAKNMRLPDEVTWQDHFTSY
ncbi:MAG: FAD-dependent thymidylate synthase [Anaerolineae bacterium]|jgi:thymidylate synthase ThyX|nr:FAD-dependent thymidylate synthase [Anaerolineae bacterium]MBT7070040.1 FAD-dependent thymidylate synthase [Anaerolineae bacterium]MBT7323621.1 FAD-dependent thymidylate synthase [Anaerolineae bacterium]